MPNAEIVFQFLFYFAIHKTRAEANGATLAYNFSCYFLCEKFSKTRQGLRVWVRVWVRQEATNCKAKEAETESIQRRQTPTNSMAAKRNHATAIALLSLRLRTADEPSTCN